MVGSMSLAAFMTFVTLMVFGIPVAHMFHAAFVLMRTAFFIFGFMVLRIHKRLLNETAFYVCLLKWPETGNSARPESESFRAPLKIHFHGTRLQSPVFA